MSVLDLSAEYPDRPDTASESEFNMWSKSKRQRWIRKLKRYVVCLRSAHHVDEHSNPDAPLRQQRTTSTPPKRRRTTWTTPPTRKPWTKTRQRPQRPTPMDKG
jgi:hypothetical protein